VSSEPDVVVIGAQLLQRRANGALSIARRVAFCSCDLKVVQPIVWAGGPVRGVPLTLSERTASIRRYASPQWSASGLLSPPRAAVTALLELVGAVSSGARVPPLWRIDKLWDVGAVGI
jgi:hypothetical protein